MDAAAPHLLSASEMRVRWFKVSAPRAVTSSCRMVLTVLSGISPSGTLAATRRFHSWGGVATRNSVALVESKYAKADYVNWVISAVAHVMGTVRTVSVQEQLVNVEFVDINIVPNGLPRKISGRNAHTPCD